MLTALGETSVAGRGFLHRLDPRSKVLFLVGLLSSVFMALNMTLIQAYSSAEMRGRMVSMAMMTFGIMPLSAIPFGAVAERIGTPDSLAIAGVILALFTVVFFFAFPRFRRVA